MRANEFINESLSRVVYHCTSVPSAERILSSGAFHLGTGISGSEEEFMKKGYPFFLSTSRTKRGGYSEEMATNEKYDGGGLTMFVLNGNWFNHHYPSRSVDYWLDRDPKKTAHRGRPHEAEDRVYSKTDSIPLKGVISIHVYSNPDHINLPYESKVRKIVIASKKQNIPVYVYDDINDWRNLNTNKTVSNLSLRDHDKRRRDITLSNSPAFHSLKYWLELLQATNKAQLSKEAAEIGSSIVSSYPKPKEDAAERFNSALTFNRRPGDSRERENLLKVVRFMQQNKLETRDAVIEYIGNKWKNQLSRLHN